MTGNNEDAPSGQSCHLDIAESSLAIMQPNIEANLYPTASE
jgi:hypothetical protein